MVPAVLALALFVFAQTALFAQNFSFTKIVDQNTARPDGQGTFYNPHGPSTDGRYVVWAEEWADFSIWSADLNNNGKLTRLADTSTAVPGGTGNFTQFGSGAGGPYGGFNIIARNGTAAFLANDSAGNGLYSVPVGGGAVTRIDNYNVTLPNGGILGAPGHPVYAFGVNDNGSVMFWGDAAGNAADGTPLSSSIYTANVDGSNLALIADEDHLFTDTNQPPSNTLNACMSNFGAAAIGGNSVVFVGSGGLNFWSIYAVPVGGPAQGVAASVCGTGPAGPLVADSADLFPGDPNTGKQIPDYGFLQTDGQNVYAYGCDWNLNCGSTLNKGWTGIFSVPLSGGAFTKIVAGGDTLPVIGTATQIQSEFSVDNGGVVFVAMNQATSQQGIYLYNAGKITKVFADGDTLDGATLSGLGTLEVWGESYKNGKIAFVWNGGVFVASPSTLASASAAGGVPTLAPGSLATAYGTDLATGTTSASTAQWPTNLGGTQVTIQDSTGATTSAPVSYVSPGQVNYFIPDNVATGTATITVISGDGTKSSSQVSLVPVAPAVFTLNGANLAAAVAVCVSSTGAQSIENVYQVVNGAIQPSPLNLGACATTVLELYATGMDSVSASNVQVTIGGMAATVQYTGPQGSFSGLDQINVVIPQTLAGSGNVPVVVSVPARGGFVNTAFVANTVNLAIE